MNSKKKKIIGVILIFIILIVAAVLAAFGPCLGNLGAMKAKLKGLKIPDDYKRILPNYASRISNCEIMGWMNYIVNDGGWGSKDLYELAAHAEWQAARQKGFVQ